MVPAVLRSGSFYSVDKAKAYNLNNLISSSVQFLLSTKFLRSLSTVREVDSHHSHQSSPSNATSSQPNSNNYSSPPEPIPNRPLRGERRRPSYSSPQSNPSNASSSRPNDSNYISPPEPIVNTPLKGERRGPSFSSAQQHEQRSQLRFGDNQKLQREKGVLEDSDFLERFKLGFDRNKWESTNPKQSPNCSQRDKYDQAGAESPPPQPPEDADEIFRKMKETGLIPNAVAMLDGLCKDGLVQEAMKLFGLMREKGTIPEVVIYTAVVEGFCKAQKLDDAVRIFRKMQSNGITPNAFSYGVLIQGLYRGKRLDDAKEFCLEMLENGHSPNVATFISLVDGFCREKGLEEAQTMINTLRQKGFFLDEKPIREYLEKKSPLLPLVWEAILGKKAPQRSSFFS
ncbi:hypothetical protein ACH5RR_041136 [Cinchona calisaya]|uniref:Pentatricopeptide repeat-containing protein n=1 Tax=Cinchona calisaya TaxID=153742 RepID=A0ABD2XT11_9GENT